MAKHKIYRQLIWLSVILTFIVIIAGAYTRLTDAGLGCPDWPGCYGQLSAPTTAKAISKAETKFPGHLIEIKKAQIEMGHRYIAGTLGLLIFFIATWGWLRARSWQLARPLLFAIVAVVVFQALLGMWTVTLKLMPIVVMAHLLGGFTLFTLLWWHNLLSHRYFAQVNYEFELKRYLPWAIIGLLLLFLQIMLGGWVSANYAALACQGIPLCHSNAPMQWDFGNAFQLWTSAQHLSAAAKQTIQMIHRIGAVIVVIYLTWLGTQIISRAQSRHFFNLCLILFCLLLLQVGLGLLNVLLSLPLLVAVLHTAVAAILLLTVVTLAYALWVNKQ